MAVRERVDGSNWSSSSGPREFPQPGSAERRRGRAGRPLGFGAVAPGALRADWPLAPAGAGEARRADAGTYGSGVAGWQGYDNYNYYSAQNATVPAGATYSYSPASWEATKASDGGLAAGGPAMPLPSYGPEPCSDSSDSLIAKINQRLDMMSKEGGRGGSSIGGEGMQDRESSFRFQTFESYDSRPCLPEHGRYRPSYSYDYELGTDRNGGFAGQYGDCRDAGREQGSLDGFVRGRGQGQGQGQGQGRFQDRFQDRSSSSSSSSFLRSEPFMPPSASSEPLPPSWSELNYSGGRGLGGPSPSRPPSSLFSQSMTPNYNMMGMQGVGGYDNTLPYGCGRPRARMQDRVSSRRPWALAFLNCFAEVQLVYCKILCLFWGAGVSHGA
ncbi:PREDICTED: A-kinase anchor protein 8-like [Dipodomys ordii]|uniref:A-kinase anchor protein 8-like n=1 Tax=Dipodomys ordii TaxID=10020 RepID=A0A1S3GVS7_DIPOR|nr:PREDICTED: A-kinase anchor protein 8-like [Dipodomys ordii]